MLIMPGAASRAPASPSAGQKTAKVRAKIKPCSCGDLGEESVDGPQDGVYASGVGHDDLETQRWHYEEEVNGINGKNAEAPRYDAEHDGVHHRGNG